MVSKEERRKTAVRERVETSEGIGIVRLLVTPGIMHACTHKDVSVLFSFLCEWVKRQPVARSMACIIGWNRLTSL